MYTTHVRSVAAIRFLEEGSHNVKMKQLIGHEDGARKTAMHELIISKGGYSAPHRHEWDHQLVVTEGRGVALIGGEKIPLRPGGVVLGSSEQGHPVLPTGEEPPEVPPLNPALQAPGPAFWGPRPS